MKKNYLFAPVIIIVILVATLFGSMASGQNKNQKVEVVKVNTHRHSEANDSLKVIVKTVTRGDDSAAMHVNIDSLIQAIESNHSPHGKKHMKFIKITDGDTLITNCWDDSLATIWIEKFEAETLQEMGSHLQKKIVLLSDSLMDISYDMAFEFDSLLDPLNGINCHTMEEGLLNIEEHIEGLNMDGAIEKEIKIMMHHGDSNMIFINDDGENIKIERKGEMVFINKSKNVKHIDSLMDVVENAEGQRVIVVQTRIVLDELNEEDQDGLKSKGLKSGKKEPEFDYVKFYPNPSSDGIQVSFKLSQEGTTEVKVTNMLGQQVYEEKLKNFDGEYNDTISLKEFGSGTYILQIIQGNRVISRKIIVE